MEDNSVWKVIPEYPSYEASNHGEIRNSTTKKTLKPFHVPDGYSQVRLSLGSRKDFKVCRVHRLVASAWIPNVDNKETVNHKNTNKHDNSIENLEWMTHKEQSLHYAELQRQNNAPPVEKYATNNEDIEGEQWKLMVDFPTYMISSKGRLKNPKGLILRGHTKTTYIQHKFTNGKHIYIHREVAKAFCENFTQKCVVNHKDGNKKNNCASNLECITQGENILHAYNINAIKRRIPIRQYDMNENLIAEYESFTQAANETNLKDGSIRWGIKYAEGRHGGFIWKKVEK